MTNKVIIRNRILGDSYMHTDLILFISVILLSIGYVWIPFAQNPLIPILLMGLVAMFNLYFLSFTKVYD
jgi:hypothetical protein